MDWQRRIDQLERSGRILLQLFEDVEEPELRWKPSPERWSLLEVMVHLWDEEKEDFRYRLFRTLEDWGEAASFGFRGEGIGAAAQPDDATWLHAFFPGTLWSTPGGAFSTTPSASTMIMGNGTYAFTSAQLVADVQSMLDDPANDFGWGVLGDELASNPIVRRYDTRENPTASFRPTLRVEYSMPAPVPATGIWASVALLAALLVLGWRFARAR